MSEDHYIAIKKKYKTASVLYSKWSRSPGIESGIVSDIRAIKAVLTNEYNYVAHDCIIPDENPGGSVNSHIDKVTANKKSDHLFVFYYAGHGQREKPEAQNPLKLVKGDGDISIEYEKIHQKLMGLECDVLVILDCCNTGNVDILEDAVPESTQEKPPPKRFNFIGACSAADSTSGDAATTMTSRLCKAINAVEGADASIWAIMGELDFLTKEEKANFLKRVNDRLGLAKASKPVKPGAAFFDIPLRKGIHFAAFSGTGSGDIFLEKLPA